MPRGTSEAVWCVGLTGICFTVIAADTTLSTVPAPELIPSPRARPDPLDQP